MFFFFTTCKISSSKEKIDRFRELKRNKKKIQSQKTATKLKLVMKTFNTQLIGFFFIAGEVKKAIKYTYILFPLYALLKGKLMLMKL